MKPLNTRRSLGVSLCAALVITGITPAMGAGEPTTAVTTKLPAFIQYIYDADPPAVNYRAVSGTVSNFSTDRFSLRCIDTSTGDRVGYPKSVTASNGKWSGLLDIQSLDLYGPCRVVLVPEDFITPSGEPAEKLAAYAKFTGPTITVNKIDYYYNLLGGPQSPWSYDAGYYFNAKKAKGEIWGVDDGGLYNWQAINATGEYGTRRISGFYRVNSQIPHAGPTGSTEAAITVDGSQAFTTYSMADSDMNMVSKSSEVKFSIITDPKTGASTFTQTSPLYKCAKPESATTLYSGLDDCPDRMTTKTQVVFVRTYKQNADGNVINVLDTFKTLDNKAHKIRYDVYNQVSANGLYRYAKTGIFGGPLTEPKTKIAGYGYVASNTPTSTDNPIFQVVYSSLPTTSWMTGSSLYSRWDLSIPKGKNKSVAVKSGVALITDDKDATSLIALAGK